MGIGLIKRDLQENRRLGGTHHQNFSTLVTPQGQHGTTTPGTPHNTSVIIVGVVVPLVLIVIVGITFYVWYRRKYPVRMVVGKDFNHFTNPKFDKRASTLTLVRHGCEDNVDAMDPADVQREDLSAVSETEAENINNEYTITVDESQHNKARTISTDGETCKNGVEIGSSTCTTNIVRERPRPKQALLVKSDDFDEFTDGFEMVTESDLGKRTDSELSSGNDSTETHTISISFKDSGSSDSFDVVSRQTDVRHDAHTMSSDSRRLSELCMEDGNANTTQITNEINLTEYSVSSVDTFELISENTNCSVENNIKSNDHPRSCSLDNKIQNADANDTINNVIDLNDQTNSDWLPDGRSPRGPDNVSTDNQSNDIMITESSMEQDLNRNTFTEVNEDALNHNQTSEGQGTDIMITESSMEHDLNRKPFTEVNEDALNRNQTSECISITNSTEEIRLFIPSVIGNHQQSNVFNQEPGDCIEAYNNMHSIESCVTISDQLQEEKHDPNSVAKSFEKQNYTNTNTLLSDKMQEIEETYIEYSTESTAECNMSMSNSDDIGETDMEIKSSDYSADKTTSLVQMPEPASPDVIITDMEIKSSEYIADKATDVIACTTHMDIKDSDKAKSLVEIPESSTTDSQVIKNSSNENNDTSTIILAPLNLPANNAYLDSAPPTPMVVIQDSIIYEPYVGSPILIDADENGSIRKRTSFDGFESMSSSINSDKIILGVSCKVDQDGTVAQCMDNVNASATEVVEHLDEQMLVDRNQLETDIFNGDHRCLSSSSHGTFDELDTNNKQEQIDLDYRDVMTRSTPPAVSLYAVSNEQSADNINETVVPDSVSYDRHGDLFLNSSKNSNESSLLPENLDMENSAISDLALLSISTDTNLSQSRMELSIDHYSNSFLKASTPTPLGVDARDINVYSFGFDDVTQDTAEHTNASPIKQATEAVVTETNVHTGFNASMDSAGASWELVSPDNSFISDILQESEKQPENRQQIDTASTILSQNREINSDPAILLENCTYADDSLETPQAPVIVDHERPHLDEDGAIADDLSWDIIEDDTSSC